jgi:hypothetical protein
LSQSIDIPRPRDPVIIDFGPIKLHRPLASCLNKEFVFGNLQSPQERKAKAGRRALSRRAEMIALWAKGILLRLLRVMLF